MRIGKQISGEKRGVWQHCSQKRMGCGKKGENSGEKVKNGGEKKTS
jgi:hypothetical protein